MGDRYVQEARAGGNASVREGRAQGERPRAAVNSLRSARPRAERSVSLCMASHEFSFMTHTASLWRMGGLNVMSAAKTLRKLCTNILDSPGILKYRRVRMAKVDSLLPEALLVHCGFSRLTYPDGEYWVMQLVDETLLRSVVKELDLAMSTAQSLCNPSAFVSDDRESAVADELVLSSENGGLRDPEPGLPQSESEAPPGASAAPVVTPVTAAPASETDLQRLLTAGKEAPSLECQLRARCAAHKLSVTTSPLLFPIHRAAVIGTVCATVLGLLAAWVSIYSGETRV